MKADAEFYYMRNKMDPKERKQKLKEKQPVKISKLRRKFPPIVKMLLKAVSFYIFFFMMVPLNNLPTNLYCHAKELNVT